MKKKLLTFLFAICLIIPCALIMTACNSGNPPPSDPPPIPPEQSYTINNQATEGIWITEQDSDSPFSNAVVEMEGSKTYAIWLSDIYDKDTLQVLFDTTTLSLDFLSDPDYEERVITESPRKIATFTIPAVTEGIHNITSSVEEEELTVKFVGSLDDFNSDQISVLNNWCLPLADGRSFAEIMGTDFTITTTFSELHHKGFSYTCKKSFGYYLTPAIFQSVEPEYRVPVEYKGGENNNEFIFNIDSGSGFTSKEIEITFDVSVLSKSSLQISGLNKNSHILHFVNGDEHFYGSYGWSVDNPNDIKIYLENCEGVNLEDVEVYIYDTQIDLQLDDNKWYFTIPSDTLPIDYYEGSVEGFILNNTYGRDFPLVIKNVVIDENADLFTQFTVTNTNPSIDMNTELKEYYTTEEGVTYYMPNNLAILTFSFETNIESASITINNNTISLNDYIEPNLDLTQDENQDSYRDEDGNYYYNNVESIINFLHITFDESGSITYMHIDFNVSNDTTVEIIFE